MIGQRILILVPHPDDEVVGASAAIGRARTEGASVAAFYLTTGVPAPEVLWPWQRRGQADRVARRQAEALAAAELLGLEPVGFCGFPTRTLRLHLAEAAARIGLVIERVKPDRLWVPAYEGGHQDHDVANFLGSRFADRVRVWEFAEYNFARGQVSLQTFPEPAGTEHVLTLSPQETARKRRALALYPSETGNLGYVKAERECFRPLATYDYSRPPHGGRCFYQRFQWVPFRHPRVDFTMPEDVCAAITGFAAGRAS